VRHVTLPVLRVTGTLLGPPPCQRVGVCPQSPPSATLFLRRSRAALPSEPVSQVPHCQSSSTWAPNDYLPWIIHNTRLSCPLLLAIPLVPVHPAHSSHAVFSNFQATTWARTVAAPFLTLHTPPIPTTRSGAAQSDILFSLWRPVPFTSPLSSKATVFGPFGARACVYFRGGGHPTLRT